MGQRCIFYIVSEILVGSDIQIPPMDRLCLDFLNSEWGGEKFELEMVPLARDWRWVMAEIAASFADLLAKHDSKRLKICENPNCRWIFYDESKSRTRRWCTNNKCANLWKVRRFRARK